LEDLDRQTTIDGVAEALARVGAQAGGGSSTARPAEP
jgi:hypothetical protein